MLLEVGKMAIDHVPILLSACQHDGTLDNRHDIAGQRSRVHGLSGTIPACGGIQVRLELQGHFVETFGQPPAEPIVSITDRSAEIADDTAALSRSEEHTSELQSLR